MSHDLAFRTLADLRRRFFARLVPLVPGGLPGVGRADLLSRFVADVDRLQDLYLRAIAPVAVALVAGGASVLIAFLMAPAAGAVLAAGLLAGGIAVPWLTRAAARAAGRRQAAGRAALTTTIVEAAGGAAEIAMAGREHDWIERADRQGARLARIQRRDALAGGLAGGLLTAVTGLTAAGVALVAIPAVRHGQLAGVLLAARDPARRWRPSRRSRPLAAAAAGIDACAAAAGRIEDVLDAPVAVADPAAPADLPPGGALELRGVRFRYGDGGPWLLDGADLRLVPGRAVALVGPSGCGKTTLAELLVRFRDPVAGDVSARRRRGPRAAQDDLRAAVCLGAQDAHLFAGTLAENLALARPGAHRTGARARPVARRPRAVARVAARRPGHRGRRARGARSPAASGGASPPRGCCSRRRAS